MGVVFASGSLAKPTARPRRPRVLQADRYWDGRAPPSAQGAAVQLAGLLPDPDAHAFANRIHQRAHCAPRFFGAAPLTWSSGPFHALPFRRLGLDMLLPQLLRGIPRNPAASQVYCSRFPPRPECPTFYRPGPCRVPNVPRFTKLLRTGRREDRACASCRRAHGRELNRFG